MEGVLRYVRVLAAVVTRALHLYYVLWVCVGRIGRMRERWGGGGGEMRKVC